MVFDRIHDAMCLNKMSRTSSRNIGPQHQKYSSVFHFTHGVLCILVFTKPILSVSGTGNGWERGPNCRRKKDLFYTKIKQTNKNYPVGEKTDWQTGWTGHKAGLDTRQDWTQGRTGHKAGLDTRQDWTQGRTGHKAGLDTRQDWTQGIQQWTDIWQRTHKELQTQGDYKGSKWGG